MQRSEKYLSVNFRGLWNPGGSKWRVREWKSENLVLEVGGKFVRTRGILNSTQRSDELVHLENNVRQNNSLLLHPLWNFHLKLLFLLPFQFHPCSISHWPNSIPTILDRGMETPSSSPFSLLFHLPLFIFPSPFPFEQNLVLNSKG